MKKNIFGFTLVELIVVVAIIGIIAIGVSKVSFNPLIDNQNSTMFTNNIFTNIEAIRNNSLLGKGFGDGVLVHPKKWTISISTNGGPFGSGSITAKYLTGSVDVNYSDFYVNFINKNSSIKELKCLNLNRSESSTGANMDLEFSGKNLTLSGGTNCGSPKNKILEIKTKYKNFEKTIRINTVTGVMERL